MAGEGKAEETIAMDQPHLVGSVHSERASGLDFDETPAVRQGHGYQIQEKLNSDPARTALNSIPISAIRRTGCGRPT
jgi:hypothetical protein